MALMSAAFLTGFFWLFFQPFRFQPCTHLVEQLIAYCESVSMTSGSLPGCARSASSTAHSSPIWLVPFVAPPASQSPGCSCPGWPPACGVWSAHAQPIGPLGLPSAEPSVETVIVMRPTVRSVADAGGDSVYLSVSSKSVNVAAVRRRAGRGLRSSRRLAGGVRRRAVPDRVLDAGGDVWRGWAVLLRRGNNKCKLK